MAIPTDKPIIGIPDPTEFGNISGIPTGQVLPLVIQRHEARKAGLHRDIRFGKDRMFSWATKKPGLPLPGELQALFQTPLHEESYMHYSGELPRGMYGAGRVSPQEKGSVVVHKATPDSVVFTTAHTRYPQTFVMVRTGNKPTDWLIKNLTAKSLEEFAGPGVKFEKEHYKSVPSANVESLYSPQATFSEKIDGARMLLKLRRHAVEAASYRPSITGEPIMHTARLQLPRGLDIPPALVGSTLLGEAYGERMPDKTGSCVGSHSAKIKLRKLRGPNPSQPSGTDAVHTGTTDSGMVTGSDSARVVQMGKAGAVKEDTLPWHKDPADWRYKALKWHLERNKKNILGPATMPEWNKEDPWWIREEFNPFHYPLVSYRGRPGTPAEASQITYDMLTKKRVLSGGEQGTYDYSAPGRPGNPLLRGYRGFMHWVLDIVPHWVTDKYVDEQFNPKSQELLKEYGKALASAQEKKSSLLQTSEGTSGIFPVLAKEIGEELPVLLSRYRKLQNAGATNPILPQLPKKDEEQEGQARSAPAEKTADHQGRPVVTVGGGRIVAPGHNIGSGHATPARGLVEAVARQPEVQKGDVLLQEQFPNNWQTKPLEYLDTDLFVSSGYSGLPGDMYVHKPSVEDVEKLKAQAMKAPEKYQFSQEDFNRYMQGISEPRKTGRSIFFIPDVSPRLTVSSIPTLLLAAAHNPSVAVGAIKAHLSPSTVRFGDSGGIIHSVLPAFYKSPVSPALTDKALSAMRESYNITDAASVYAQYADQLEAAGDLKGAGYIRRGIAGAAKAGRPYSPILITGSSRGDYVAQLARDLREALRRNKMQGVHQIVPILGAHAGITGSILPPNMPPLKGAAQDMYAKLRAAAALNLASSGASDSAEMRGLGAPALFHGNQRLVRLREIANTRGLTPEDLEELRKIETEGWNAGLLQDIEHNKPHGMRLYHTMDDVITALRDTDFMDRVKNRARGLAALNASDEAKTALGKAIVQEAIRQAKEKKFSASPAGKALRVGKYGAGALALGAGAYALHRRYGHKEDAEAEQMNKAATAIGRVEPEVSRTPFYVKDTQPKKPKKHEHDSRAQLQDKVASDVIPVQELGGILNASLGESLRQQREKKIKMRVALFNILSKGKTPVGPDVPYKERVGMLQEILPHLPKDTFHLPEMATTPEEQKALWSRIQAGQNPRTREGVVVFPETGTPTKVKVAPEYDIVIRRMFPSLKGKYKNVGVGGFEYSLPGSEELVGKVGTGFSDELRKDMLEHPEQYTGRTVRIKAMGQFPSGAYRAPSLIAMHEG